MKKTFIAMMAMAALSALPAFADPVQIASAADWAAFANRVNNGETSLDAVMTADVTLTGDPVRVGLVTSGDGAVEYTYSGEFDGDGHTITLDWSTGGMKYLAPFAYVSGCTIRNLHIAGSITTGEGYVAGFIGCVYGSATLEECRCSVSITVETGGSSAWMVGGFFSDTNTYVDDGEIVFRNCLFDGALQLSDNGIYCAGFGHSYANVSSVKIYDSLFAPSNVEVPSPADFCWTFTGTTKGELSNIYRTKTFGNDAGIDASSMSVESLVAALGSSWSVVAGKAMPASLA